MGSPGLGAFPSRLQPPPTGPRGGPCRAETETLQRDGQHVQAGGTSNSPRQSPEELRPSHPISPGRPLKPTGKPEAWHTVLSASCATGGVVGAPFELLPEGIRRWAALLASQQSLKILQQRSDTEQQDSGCPEALTQQSGGVGKEQHQPASR